jgi:hypothetical protein
MSRFPYLSLHKLQAPLISSQGTGQKVPEDLCQERRSGGQNPEFLATCGIPIDRDSSANR